MREGKGKAPLNNLTRVQMWEAYLDLWRRWAKLNSISLENLRIGARQNDFPLTDMFATTEINQARALATILNET